MLPVTRPALNADSQASASNIRQLIWRTQNRVPETNFIYPSSNQTSSFDALIYIFCCCISWGFPYSKALNNRISITDKAETRRHIHILPEMCWSLSSEHMPRIHYRQLEQQQEGMKTVSLLQILQRFISERIHLKLHPPLTYKGIQSTWKPV